MIPESVVPVLMVCACVCVCMCMCVRERLAKEVRM